ncbi:MAG TPA: hypothetical protein VNE38_18745 [Ktedonobacteraceae bacterium]|nr:hypothetical protein [Ktedonobacteraceae bacterium]
MEIPIALKNLAESLEDSKDTQSPYNLLLTSTISLTPEVLKEICGSDQWGDFSTRLRRSAYNQRINLLERHLSGYQNENGYQSLVRLIEKGYFSTVLTTNLDSTLEDILSKSPSKHRELVVGRDKNQHIVNALDSGVSEIRIIKLHGSLRDEVLSEAYPDYIDLEETIKRGLARYINQDTVIIGSIEREKDIASLLVKSSKGSIYYALPDMHVPNDTVTTIIRVRGYNPDDFIISGHFGQFETFCKTLESLLESRAPTVSPIISHSRNQPVKPFEPASVKASQISPPRQLHEQVSTPSQSQIERKQESTTNIEQQEKERASLSIMVIKIISGVFAIGALLVAVSLFINLTPSFNSAFIIPLIIILAVIILGIMGILQADQIVQIFLQGLNVKGTNDTSSKPEKGDTGTSISSQPSLPHTTVHEELPAAPTTGEVLQKENKQSVETADNEVSSLPDSITQAQPAQTKETIVPVDTKMKMVGSILELSPKSQNDKIKLTNQLYKQIWDARSEVLYASSLFDYGKTVSDLQYNRLVDFLGRLNKPPSDLLETIELLPGKILPWRFPLRDALDKVVAEIADLSSLIIRPDRAALRQKIQQKFQLLSDNIDEVKQAFSDLCIRFHDDTWLLD